MRAPPSPLEDFVRSIAEGLKPWTSAETHVLECVQATIDAVRRVADHPPTLGLRNINKSAAKNIKEAAAALQQLLESTPRETIRLLFSPLTFPLPDDHWEEMFERGEAEGRAKTIELAVMLRDLCSRCEDIRKFGPGDDPRATHGSARRPRTHRRTIHEKARPRSDARYQHAPV